MAALRIGGYEVETLLGPGGVTETYRVRRAEPPDPAGRSYALKLLRDDRGGEDPEVLSRFAAAAARAAALDEPGLVGVVEVPSPTADPAFIISEIADGIDLTELVDNAGGTGLDPDLVGRIVAEVARILAALEDRAEPVAHGSLCPGNVHVGRDGTIRLSDVGITSALRPLTEHGVDKWLYVAPELCEGTESATPAGDLWSLGAVTLFLLTGHSPYEAESIEELREKMKAGAPALPAVPEWLAKPLRSMLSVNPRGRPRAVASTALALASAPGTAAQLAALVRGEPNSGSIAKVAPTTKALPGTSPLPAPPGNGVSLRPLVQQAAGPGGAPAGGAGFAPGGGTNAGVFAPLAAGAPGTGGGFALAPPGTLLGGAALIGPPSVQALGLAPAANPGDSLYEDVAGVGMRLPPPVAPVAFPDPANDGIMDLPMMTQSRVELPDMVDRAAEGPGFVGLPSRVGMGPAPQTSAGGGFATLPEHAGMTALSADSPDIGVIEEDDNGEAGTATGLARKQIVLPRMRGSARPTGASKKKASSKGVAAVLAVLVLGGAGAVAYKTLSAPTKLVLPVVAVTPPVANNLVRPDAGAKGAASASARKTQPGRLSINSSPAGATVWLDGVEKGRTPTTLTTKPGGHRLVIVKPGYRMLRETVDTTDGALVNRTMATANTNLGGTAALKVQCKTEDKYPIFIDGRDTGLLCPVEDLLVPEGMRQVGLFVISQNKLWTFEREILPGTKSQKVTFNY